MEAADYLRFVFALFFVLALIGACALAARRFGLAPGAATGGGNRLKRLEIVESLALDQKRRMVIVRRDGTEHLILIGNEGETLVETGFTAPAPDPVEDTADLPAARPARPALAPVRTAETAGDGDDIFARLRKVAELMQDMRQNARPRAHQHPLTASHDGEPVKRAAGGQA